MTSSGSLMRRPGLDEALINMQYLEIKPDEVELSPLRVYAAGGSCILRIGAYTYPDPQREQYVRINVGVKVFKNGYTEEDRINAATRFIKELEVWATLKHENLLSLSGYYIARDLSEAWLISEWQHNGNLKEYAYERGLDLRLQLLGDVLQALEYLHSMYPPILHRDIKPGNVLIGSNPPRAMLCDFGLCKSPSPGSVVLNRASSVEAADASVTSTLSDLTSSDHIFTSQSDELKGTFRYMAPELFQQIPPPYSEASDMWAWACTAHEVISGEIPYGWCRTEPKVLQAMNEGRIPPTKIYPEGSWELVQQIFRCWQKNPRSRPSAKECRDELHAGYPIQTLAGLQSKDTNHNEPRVANNIDSLERLQQTEQTIRIHSIITPMKEEWSVRIVQPQIIESDLICNWAIETSRDVPYSKLPTFLQEYVIHRAHRFRREDSDLEWIAWSLHDPLKPQFIALYGPERGSTPSLEWSTLPRLDVLLWSVGRAGLMVNLKGFRFTPNGGTLTFGSSLGWPIVGEPYVAFPLSLVSPMEDPEKADEDDQASEALLEKFAGLRLLFASGIPFPSFYHFCAAYFILEAPGPLRRLQNCARRPELRNVEIDPLVEGLPYDREDFSTWNDRESTDKLRTLIDDMVPVIQHMMTPYLKGVLEFLPYRF